MGTKTRWCWIMDCGFGFVENWGFVGEVFGSNLHGGALMDGDRMGFYSIDLGIKSLVESWIILRARRQEEDSLEKKVVFMLKVKRETDFGIYKMKGGTAYKWVREKRRVVGSIYN